MKKCNKCNEVKPFNEMVKDKTYSDGHKAQCKECRNKTRKLTDRLHRLTHPLVQKEASVNTCARARGYKNLTTKGWCIRLYEYWNHSCALCGFDNVKALQVDHMVPLSRGGLHEDSNLVLLCANCHCIKGQDTIGYVFQVVAE